jgi:hypothetical protein
MMAGFIGGEVGAQGSAGLRAGLFRFLTGNFQVVVQLADQRAFHHVFSGTSGAAMSCGEQAQSARAAKASAQRKAG